MSVISGAVCSQRSHVHGLAADLLVITLVGIAMGLAVWAGLRILLSLTGAIERRQFEREVRASERRMHEFWEEASRAEDDCEKETRSVFGVSVFRIYEDGSAEMNGAKASEKPAGRRQKIGRPLRDWYTLQVDEERGKKWLN